MPEIRGGAFTGHWASCVWCGDATDSWGDTPGRPELGRVPIHVFCAGAVIAAYRRVAGGYVTAGTMKAIAEYVDRSSAYLRSENVSLLTPTVDS